MIMYVRVWKDPSTVIFFRYAEFTELNEEIVDLLNRDWRESEFYRIACGKLLTSALLVEEKQILLINGVELYDRRPTMDLHYERFGYDFSVTSLPNFKNLYKQINVCLKNEAKSRKLIVGTLVFNALIVSSLRLDKEYDPEVGVSTYLFNPSANTKIYISKRNISEANLVIKQENMHFNFHDLESQIRQLRSYLTMPSTYVNARCFSPWTDNGLCRPYSIFTLKDRSIMESTDDIIASKILSQIASSMRRKRGILQKSELEQLVVIKAETHVTKILKSLLEQFGNKEEMVIIGNSLIESLLMDLAKIVTQRLKDANEAIKPNIVRALLNF